MNARLSSRIAASTLAALTVALLVIACGREESAPTAASSGHDHAAAAPGAEKAQAGATETYYTCPMHPSVNSSTPGQCPICGMDLVAVARGSESAAVDIGTERAQLIGVKTIAVERDAFAPEIRTLGRVTYDETQLTDVTVKFAGFIGTLHADSAGKHVERGAPLFEIYSPELYAAQQEFLSAIASSRRSNTSSSFNLSSR
jgi:Cu(I)/Ag(I) efflux system membrane fusion protein